MRTRRARRSLAGALAALSALATTARADDIPVSLEWRAPAGCPSRDDVLAGVGKILGGKGGTWQAVSARAVVTKGASGRWTVELETRAGDSEGERSVSASSCRALADATALILALAANAEDAPPTPVPATSSSERSVSPPASSALPGGTGAATPSAPGEASPPRASPDAPAPPEVASTPPTPPPAPPEEPPNEAPAPAPAPGAAETPERPTPHRLGLSLSAAGDLGLLPGFGTGGEAAIGARLFRVRVEASVTFWASQTTTVALPTTATGSATAAADFSLLSVEARAGYPIRLAALELVPGLSFEADTASASASGTKTTASAASSTWTSLAAGGLVFWSITREFAVRFGLEAAVPFVRPTFVITNGPQVFQPGPIEGKGTIGLEVRFL